MNPSDHARLVLAQAQARRKEEDALQQVAAELRKQGAPSEADVQKVIANLRARGRAGSGLVYGGRQRIKASRAERFGVGIAGDDAAAARRRLRNARKAERRN